MSGIPRPVSRIPGQSFLKPLLGTHWPWLFPPYPHHCLISPHPSHNFCHALSFPQPFPGNGILHGFKSRNDGRHRHLPNHRQPLAARGLGSCRGLGCVISQLGCIMTCSGESLGRAALGWGKWLLEDEYQQQAS